MFSEIVEFIERQFPGQRTVGLHEPRFRGNERRYVLETIDSTFVSSVGPFVTKFEAMLAELMNVEPERVVAVVNGTNALQVALQLAGVRTGDLVVTQSLTFIATCNAIKYLHADPAFVDVEESTLGMSPESLAQFLESKCRVEGGRCTHVETGRRVSACVPMHTFGHPARIDEIIEICARYSVTVVEDAAESLGSVYHDRAAGAFGELAVLSFNGNKIVTTGGGGAIVARSKDVGKRAKHLTTTAKVPHPWAFVHDEIGYNFRMPNLNAALGCAQLENLGQFLEEKRRLALAYSGFFEGMTGVKFITEPEGAKSNYWLNAILFESLDKRDEFLKYSHSKGVLCRPVWVPMHQLELYKNCVAEPLPVTEYLADRIVNLPSSAAGVKS